MIIGENYKMKEQQSSVFVAIRISIFGHGTSASITDIMKFCPYGYQCYTFYCGNQLTILLGINKRQNRIIFLVAELVGIIEEYFRKTATLN